MTIDPDPQPLNYENDGFLVDIDPENFTNNNNNNEYDNNALAYGNVKYNKLMKLLCQVIIANKILFVILIVSSLVFIYLCNDTNTTNKTIIISPDPTDSYYDNIINYDYSTMIIKPCIYNNRQTCQQNYELINTNDICNTTYQNDHICILDNLFKSNPNAFYPSCISVNSIDLLYKNGEIIRDSVIINPKYYQDSAIIAFISLLSLVNSVILFVIYLRYITRSDAKLNDCISLLNHLYSQLTIMSYLIAFMLFILFGGALAMITKSSIKFIAQVISINCSNVDIYNTLSFVQKILVAFMLNTNYEDMAMHMFYFYCIRGIFEFVSLIAFGILVYFILRIVIFRIKEL